MFSLPEPDRTVLKNSPLVLVVCQIRFEENLAIGDSRTILRIHDDLGGRKGLYRRIQPLRGSQLEFALGPNQMGQATSTPHNGWQLFSGDGAWTLTLMPDHCSLQTTTYGTWENDFRPRLADLLKALDEHVEPALEERMGLRYIDHLLEPSVDSPKGWEPYISSELLGPILHPAFGGAIESCVQQVILQLDETVKSNIRHGLLQDPNNPERPGYLIDLDVYREEASIFDSESIMSAADDFNDVALRLFQQSITSRMLETLQGGN